MDELFTHMVQTTRVHARETVRAYRERTAPPDEVALPKVWLLWAGFNVVLGVYGSEQSALETLALLPRDVNAWVEERCVGA